MLLVCKGPCSRKAIVGKTRKKNSQQLKRFEPTIKRGELCRRALSEAQVALTRGSAIGATLSKPTSITKRSSYQPVEHVDGKRARKSLDLESQLEGLHQEDQPLSVLDGESGMVELVDDLFPVQRLLHLVDNLM